MAERVSIIIPVLDEEAVAPATLASLQPLRRAGCEIIVVDGGSTDSTVARTGHLVDRLLGAERGRARQMNAGAGAAVGEWLLFQHADTLLPAAAIDAMTQLPSTAMWGCFDVRLSGDHPLLRCVETAMNWRSRLTGIATGDQAIFVRREAFRTTGAYPEIDLMEDVALSCRLRSAYGWPARLRVRVVTSSRRWERNGVARTIVRMWWLRLCYATGVSPARLAQWY